jgi:hypothetical protein
MATEEIEISELEYTEELASDNLIPVESATDTKATSLQILKNWLSSFFVGKTGNEIISGEKTFSNSVVSTSIPFSFIARGKMEKGVTPTANTYTGIDFRDKNNERLAYLGISYLADGRKQIEFQRQDASLSELVMSYRIRAYAPDVESSTNELVTAQWVRNLLTGAIDINGGYFPLPNNVLVQFGAINTSEGSNVNLPKPFANNNYKVVISGYTTQTTGSANYASVINTTTTGFTVVPAKVGSFAWVAIGMK